nr:hypothetical protein Itr_chr05CG13480 [Ipomoea trifida]
MGGADRGDGRASERWAFPAESVRLFVVGVSDLGGGRLRLCGRWTAEIWGLGRRAFATLPWKVCDAMGGL